MDVFKFLDSGDKTNMIFVGIIVILLVIVIYFSIETVSNFTAHGSGHPLRNGNGLCSDILGPNGVMNGKVSMKACSSANNSQQWLTFPNGGKQIKNIYPSETTCLTGVQDGSVYSYMCMPNFANQTWTVNTATGQVKNNQTKQCLDYNRFEKIAGTAPCDTKKITQKWS